MSYTYHGTTDLIALPGRSVQTFPSGLVRVDRTYACRPQFAQRYRRELAVGFPLPLDNGHPAIDGLFIFPEAQETQGEDGFVEFRVSGYGRTTAFGSEKIEDEYITESVTVNSIFIQSTQFITRSKILTQEFVVLGSEDISPTTDKIPAGPKLIFGSVDALFELRNRRYRVALRSYTARNFGRFSEVVATYAPVIIVQRKKHHAR